MSGMLSIRYTFFFCCYCFVFFYKLTIRHFPPENNSFFSRIRHTSSPLRYGKNVQQNVQFFYNTASRRAENYIMRFTTNVQTCLATIQFVASCENTDFWLVKITRESRYTQNLRHLLQSTFALRPVKRATWADFVAKRPDWCWTSLIRGWYTARKIATQLAPL